MQPSARLAFPSCHAEWLSELCDDWQISGADWTWAARVGVALAAHGVLVTMEITETAWGGGMLTISRLATSNSIEFVDKSERPMLRFAAAACLVGPDHVRQQWVASTPGDWLMAREPMAAAQKWFWRLAPSERARICKIIISSPDGLFEEDIVYQGPPLTYQIFQGRLHLTSHAGFT